MHDEVLTAEGIDLLQQLRDEGFAVARDELQRTEIAGSSSSECWQVKQNTSRFRAQVIGIA